MAMKVYEINGKAYQYREGEQPKGAVEVKAEKKPANKSAKKPVNKGAAK